MSTYPATFISGKKLVSFLFVTYVLVSFPNHPTNGPGMKLHTYIQSWLSPSSTGILSRVSIALYCLTHIHTYPHVHSYSYDLTLSLQCQMRTYPGPAPPPCRKFIWNDHMLQQFEGYVHPKWVLHIMYGFVGQYSILGYLIWKLP